MPPCRHVPKCLDHVSWTTKYAETDKGEFATRSTLKVRNSNVDDTGLYQCFAYNDHQTAMDSASVFVSCKYISYLITFVRYFNHFYFIFLINGPVKLESSMNLHPANKLPRANSRFVHNHSTISCGSQP